jgi:hypothetical protein
MAQAKKNAKVVIDLPDPGVKPMAKGPDYEFLNPNGNEIYKVDARYPTQPPKRKCRFTVIWKGGPAGANTSIHLIDIKNWVVLAQIWIGPNVGSGQVGSKKFTLPSNFKPTDDCNTASPYPLKPGKYQVYIQNNPVTTWTYGPEFTIVWGY